MASPIVRTERLTRSFGSLMAVAHVDFEVERGELRSIIGPNGAGKTTFFRLISGEMAPSGGRIWFDGREITGLPQHRVSRLGVAKSYQITNIFPHLSVLENVRVAAQTYRLSFNFWGRAVSLVGIRDKAGAILKLSGLMRYMLVENVDGRVELQKEVDYLHNYIDIYRLRFEDCFFVNFTIEGAIAGQRIASLVLIPFVENAFKHGVVDQATKPVDIRLRVFPGRLEFAVDNSINHHQKDPSSGIGLVNIRRRLELIYPGRHTLSVSGDGEKYRVALSINFAE